MVKKISIVAGFGAFLLVSSLAPAQKTQKTPSTSTSSDGTVLGVLDGVVSFCAKVSPGSASTYRELSQFITNGQSAQAVTQVRDSDLYQKAYQQVGKDLKTLSANDAVAACNAH
jgi:hypothetical protein